VDCGNVKLGLIGVIMANREHLTTLRQGVDPWNKWRAENPEIKPDLIAADFKDAILNGANLNNVDLQEVDFCRTSLRGAKLIEANLFRADLFHADLTDANLSGSNLSYASLVEADLSKATLSNCRVYGTSAWNLTLVDTKQSNLVITRENEPQITVDYIEMAQFIYLLLNHQKLRDTINSVTEKGVLILGRFGGGGLEVLRQIAAKLRELRYLPIIFDFERPESRNYTEVIKTLVGLSRFVIVDLSGPSVPQELYATVPNFKIPFVPILEEGRREYAMFSDILEYPWVIKPLVKFTNIKTLIENLPSMIIEPAEENHQRRQQLLEQLFSKGVA
jgi:uncharacterized protein YjbI with pentapeptide repeats